MKNKAQEIIDKLSKEGKVTKLLKEESGKINSRISSEMKNIKKVKPKDYEHMWELLKSSLELLSLSSKKGHIGEVKMTVDHVLDQMKAIEDLK